MRDDVDSVIQPDFWELVQTGNYAVHHVFPGSGRRRKCEEYGFLVALRPALHMEVHMHPNTGADKVLKDACKAYWLEHYGTEQEFIEEFGKF